MTAKEKNKFNQMQELDKKRFQTEMQVYNQVQNCECFRSTLLWRKQSSHNLQCENVVIFPLSQSQRHTMTMEIMGIFSHAFLAKFRESNGFTK